MMSRRTYNGAGAIGLTVLALTFAGCRAPGSAAMDPAAPARNGEARSPAGGATRVAREPRLLEAVEARTRDGVALMGDVFLPAAEGRYPVILELTPYGRGVDGINYRGDAPYWTSRGYAFALFDARGQGASGGTFEFMLDGPDAADVIAWLADQSWSSGAVGMIGSSYTGSNQWLAAREQPLALRCLTPAAAWHDPFAVVPYNGGAFVSRHALTWPALLSDSRVDRTRQPDYQALLSHRPLQTADEATYGRSLRLFRQWIANGTDDDYWRARTLQAEDFARIRIPTLAFTGYFDELHAGTIANYQAMRQRSPNPDRQYLVIGPWEHATVVDGGLDYRNRYAPARAVRNLDLPDRAFLDSKEIYGRFFDWCLKDGAAFEQPSARVYVTGSNRWLDLPSYPPPTVVPRALYLHSAGKANGRSGDGRLSWERPSLARASSQYVFDPLDPGAWRPTRAGTLTDAAPPREPVDLGAELDRADVLVFVTEPLQASLTVVGNVRLVLHAATDGRDTDWAARLEDVAPDGTAIRHGVGPAAMLRARYRQGFTREVLLTPGESYEYTLDFHDLGHTFLAGHRIRLSVSSAAYPWVHPNPNTGNPIETDTATPRQARQTIFHEAVRASHLLLPVLPEPAVPR